MRRVTRAFASFWLSAFSGRDQLLVKLAIAVGLSSEGGVRSHVRPGLA